MTTPDPLTPRSALSPETLRAYAEGHLDAAAAHEVELHLEADPFLRDAVDGLRTPGAMAGANALKAHRPTSPGNSWAAWTLTAVVVATIGTASYYFFGRGFDPQDPAEATTVAVIDQPKTSAPLIEAVEIQAAVEIPESLHIGHASTDRHALTQVSVQASMPMDTATRTSIDPVAPKRTSITDTTNIRMAAPEKHGKPSLQLVYLHDLKLLHPKEMYGRSPLVEAPNGGVDARFANAAERDQARAQERRVAYLTFMDEALEKFVQNDHKACLEDLRFVLDQYPDDVNALFYAGLCCYNLGLNERAERFFDRASTHSLRVFDEEAEWYHALALQRRGEMKLARSAFERIAAQRGFYGERATRQLALK